MNVAVRCRRAASQRLPARREGYAAVFGGDPLGIMWPRQHQTPVTAITPDSAPQDPAEAA